jgi:hypothetical protein
MTPRLVCQLLHGVLRKRYGDEAPRPEVHTPQQRNGDLADLALFPNPAAPTATRKVDEELEESRRLAGSVSVSVQWPDPDVRQVDRLSDDEQYWVVYATNSGDRPVHDVKIFLLGENDDPSQIPFPPLEPGRRQWYILRPDSGFDAHAFAPDAWIEFDALGWKWRSEDGDLKFLSPIPRGISRQLRSKLNSPSDRKKR